VDNQPLEWTGPAERSSRFASVVGAGPAIQRRSVIEHGGDLGEGDRYDGGMDAEQLTIAAFQKHILERYEKVDRERGTAKTFLWFIEEVGELATALNGEDRANLEEEFADVVAWLCTLANINDVDLAGAIGRKYLSGSGPEGHK
jgi:NTP pyrophosphatase (non-canonical NTP hydrolase)